MAAACARGAAPLCGCARPGRQHDDPCPGKLRDEQGWVQVEALDYDGLAIGEGLVVGAIWEGISSL